MNLFRAAPKRALDILNLDQRPIAADGLVDEITCEALRLRLAQNGTLTREEKDLIEFSALELLDHVKPLE